MSPPDAKTQHVQHIIGLVSDVVSASHLQVLPMLSSKVQQIVFIKSEQCQSVATEACMFNENAVKALQISLSMHPYYRTRKAMQPAHYMLVTQSRQVIP